MGLVLEVSRQLSKAHHPGRPSVCLLWSSLPLSKGVMAEEVGNSAVACPPGLWQGWLWACGLSLALGAPRGRLALSSQGLWGCQSPPLEATG